MRDILLNADLSNYHVMMSYFFFLFEMVLGEFEVSYLAVTAVELVSFSLLSVSSCLSLLGFSFSSQEPCPPQAPDNGNVLKE